MRRSRERLAGACLAGILLSAGGCTTLGPDFQTPEAAIAEEWKAQDAARIQKDAEFNHDWWTALNDPVLDDLVDIAYQQNLPLQISGLRILQARAQLGIAIGQQFPQFQQAAGALTRDKLSENQPNFNPALDDKYWQVNAGFDASWELDFWGRFRRGVESASANLGSQIASYDDALVSVTAEVARIYVVIRTLEERVAIARDNAKTQERSYQIADVKFRNGAVSELDPSQALTLLRSTEAQIPELETQLHQAMNALSILLGMPPGDLSSLLQGEKGIPSPPAEIAVGIPADLLRRRPDIRQAELQAASQSAAVGVAVTELYPRFSLVGSIGFLSSDTNESDLDDLFESDSFGYSVGPSFAWPILNYGRLKNNVRVQDARLEEALVNYQNTVLEALREVEDGLAGFTGTNAQAVLLVDSVKAAERSVHLALIQYRDGAVDYQRVLDTQQSLLSAQDRYTNVRGEIVLNLVATYKALGGGWQIRAGNDILPQERQEQMRDRTDWGGLIPETVPDDLPGPPPTGKAQPMFNRPDW